MQNLLKLVILYIILVRWKTYIMNEQVLSPEIEKALADLRQAIIAQLQNSSSASTSAPLEPVSAAINPIAPVNEMSPASVVTPAPDAPVAPAGLELPGLEAIPTPAFTPAAPAAIPTPETSTINLPDLGASTNNVTDLSGMAPEAAPAASANNGLDDSAPILPPLGGPDLSAPVDLTAAAPADAGVAIPPVMPAATIEPAPASATPETISAVPTPPVTTAPEPAPAPTGLPKANSLLSSVLKKGWNSNQ